MYFFISIPLSQYFNSYHLISLLQLSKYEVQTFLKTTLQCKALLAFSEARDRLEISLLMLSKFK